MTNSGGGLEVTGLKYVIDDSELNATYARIQQQIDKLEKRGPAAAKAIEAALKSFGEAANVAFNEKLGRYVDTSTKKIISQAEAIARSKVALNGLAQDIDRVDKKTTTPPTQPGGGGLDYNSRSLRSFAADLVYVSGAGGQATGIISSLLYAVGPLDVAFAAAGAGALLLKAGLDAAHSSFEKQQQDLANTTHSFEGLYAARIKPTPLGFVSALPDILGDLKDAAFKTVGQELGDSFGQAFVQGFAGQLTPEKLARLFITARNPLDLIGKTIAGAQEAYAKQQLDAATSQYVGAAAARESVKSLQEEVDSMIRAGASADVLTQKIYALQKAQVAAGQASGIVTGGSIEQYLASQTARLAQLERQQGQSTDRKGGLNARATKFGEDILAAQQQFQDDSASAYTDYQDRMAVIAEQGERARLRLNENYGRQIADLQENEHQAELDAFTNLAESIAAAEENANEQRAKNAENFADRRVQIEQSYQDQIKQITQSYEEAVFSAAGRNDAHALIEAQRNRDNGLKAADEQRKRDADAAKVAYDKQQKELNDALKKQERKLHEEYDKRIRQLEDALKKQEKKAGDQHDRDLKDLNDSQTDQQKAEKKHYDARTAAIAKSFTDRKAQLIKGLEAEQGITDKYARAIIASMKGILRPDEIAALIKEFDAQLKAKIDISVTPFATERKGSKPPPPPPDPTTGQCPPGYHTDNDGQCVPDEGSAPGIAFRLPVVRSARLPQLIPDIYQARVPLPEPSGVMLANFLQRQVPFNMPSAQRYAGASAPAGAPAKIQVIIENRLNNKMLESTVRTITDSQITVVVREAGALAK